VLTSRLSLYGAAAARLHEEVIPITAVWTEADRGQKPLRALGEMGGLTTLNQLEDAFRTATPAPPAAMARIQPLIHQDIADLRPALERIAAERREEAEALLAKRGADEAKALAELLAGQIARIRKAAEISEKEDPNQFALPGVLDEERRERALDRKHWARKLADLERQLAEEPERIRRFYTVQAARLEPVGLVYLWPQTG